ncbi:putative suppressor of disruption of TFIIS [Neonectria magnoliae]|uniref:Suppressor of disruption of TFIIS n=1 Tax=Neonectria magnoliae TaxID=2732573 RepID=A0ABR1HZC4_9HYPO
MSRMQPPRVVVRPEILEQARRIHTSKGAQPRPFEASSKSPPFEHKDNLYDYVENMTHDGWRKMLPAWISLWKKGTTTVAKGRSPCVSDIDNCLYSRSLGVQDLLPALMNAYFEKHLSLSKEEAARLQREYSRQYGQAIQGLVRHHQIDPLDYNAKCDDALPLEDLIKPDPSLRQFLESIDTSKVKLWLLTNAYINHATRVIRLLGVDDLFEGLTYCDYAQVPLVCKPHEDMFRKAMEEADASDVGNCYFIGKMTRDIGELR